VAVPKVFISSTCYDLRYIRENLKYFITTLGYDPVLSEEGSVYFNPTLHTHDSCLAEVPNAQVFVLIIGGRFGSAFKDQEHSITNAEFREATKLRIPIFALVDQGVHNDYYLFLKNRSNDKVDPHKILYPSVDNTKIFSFIDEVQSASINNALVPFANFDDIKNYLQQQWAGMMHSFLTTQNEHRRVSDALDAIAQMNERIEMLSKQILKSVGSEDAKLDAKLYDLMIGSEAIRNLSYWGLKPTPISVLVNAGFRACAKSLGMEPVIDENDLRFAIGTAGAISRPLFDKASRLYKELRQAMTAELRGENLTPEQYIQRRITVEG
jgi:hypothetical protein